MVIARAFKYRCAACGVGLRDRSKEHFWPEWLIARTGTHKTSVRLTQAKRVNPRALTVPLCAACNRDFGRELEGPVARIFRDLEAGLGLSDSEAELLIRWLWKLGGLAWMYGHPEAIYATRPTLRNRVLRPIGDIRSQLTLAVSIIETIDPRFNDAPMGLDSESEEDTVFVAGVFSRTALMVLLRGFESEVPEQFSLYRLAPLGALDRDAKLFHPRCGFHTCVEAVGTTRVAALFLSHAHDLELRQRAS